jgi:anti-sigma factor ChrR (cupin superfamily)
MAHHALICVNGAAAANVAHVGHSCVIEEFLVLEGVFQDEHGAFPAGSYVRNPPTSRHTPSSATGCILFVKLWQFDPADRKEVKINTADIAYQPAADRQGVELLPLFRDDSEDVRLERWMPNAPITLNVPVGAELLVLDGGFDEGGESFEPLSWLRLPTGSALQAKAGPKGCRVWIKTGPTKDSREPADLVCAA